MIEDASARTAGQKTRTRLVVNGRAPHVLGRDRRKSAFPKMEVWNKPQVSEQAVGLEVTSYLPAEIDLI